MQLIAVARGGGGVPGDAPGDDGDSDVGGGQDGRPAGVVALVRDEREAAADLAAIVQMAAPAPKRYAQRSWQLLAHARSQKAVKRARTERDTALASSRAATILLSMAGAQFPDAAAALGLPKTRQPMGPHRAAVMVRLSLMPSMRGNSRHRKTQACAVSLVAAAAEAEQQMFVKRVFFPSADDTKVLPGAPADTLRIVSMSWQWDETSQRLRSVHQHRLPGERLSPAGMSVQVMMQHGRLQVHLFDSDGVRSMSSPLLAKGLRLEDQTADTLLEGLLLRLPVDISEPPVLQRMSSSSDFIVLSFCVDRAAANLSALKWLWSRFAAPGVSDAILPHAELCAAHGVALVKSRSALSKAVVSKAHTLSGLLRNARTSAAFRDAIIAVVQASLEVRFEPRPARIAEQNDKILLALFAADDEAYLWKKNPKGEVEPGSLLQDLTALAAVIELGGTRLVHYCSLDHDAANPAVAGGRHRPCCEHRDESVSKVAGLVVNLLVSRAWDTSATSRWTYVVSTLRKNCSVACAKGYCRRRSPGCRRCGMSMSPWRPRSCASSRPTTTTTMLSAVCVC